MRIITPKTLRRYAKQFSEAKQPLLSWGDEIAKADWKNHNDLKLQFRKASILNSKRVVFDMCGNKYRLIVSIEYKYKLVFIIWMGTHKQYDNIDAKTIQYVKAN